MYLVISKQFLISILVCTLKSDFANLFLKWFRNIIVDFVCISIMHIYKP